ncbi:Os11g0686250, partial [Oryza sativa Japonica Group]
SRFKLANINPSIHRTLAHRGYYRCATKGCQASKQVQRHDDGLLFDVTYFGEHTCADQPQAAHSSDQVQVTLWPPAVSPEQPLTPQSGLEQSSTVTVTASIQSTTHNSSIIGPRRSKREVHTNPKYMGCDWVTG